jgi:ABC-type sugar transport system ATPase subunit
MNDAPFLELRAIVKRFPGVVALNGVSLELRAGEVHALLGENGAGKSTLIKTISGVYQPDAGEIRVDGRPITIRNPYAAQTLGISTIYQEFTLAPDMTVAENIFLGREPLRIRALSIIDRRQLVRRARELLASLDLQIDPEASVRDLGVAQQQMVEIVKALSLDARLIIMDEPTATLTAHEIDRLFEAVRRLRQRGVAIVYVSHRLDEVEALCDRATILRDGAYVATMPVASTSIDEMIRLMVGRGTPARRGAHAKGRPARRQLQRSARGDRRHRRPRRLEADRDRTRDLRRRPDRQRPDLRARRTGEHQDAI